MFYNNKEHIVGQEWQKYEGHQHANLVTLMSGDDCLILLNRIQTYDGGNHPTAIVKRPVIRNELETFEGTVYQVTDSEGDYTGFAVGDSIEDITKYISPMIKDRLSLGKL